VPFNASKHVGHILVLTAPRSVHQRCQSGYDNIFVNQMDQIIEDGNVNVEECFSNSLGVL